MRVRHFARWMLVCATLPPLAGCVTVAEFRKLERDVRSLQRGGGSAVPGGGGERVAELAAQLEAVEAELSDVKGRLEVAERQSHEALEEAQAARADAAAPAAPAGSGAEASPPPPDGASPQEIADYREAYAAWRAGESEACIDRFRNFLQTYPSSGYADDASYWMADCYFKHGDYKTAVLRFDDVVSRYPTGNKAADALYRQGEALLRLGPGYGKAAGKAFERVVKEYPDSARAPEAKKQLDLLSAG